MQVRRAHTHRQKLENYSNCYISHTDTSVIRHTGGVSRVDDAEDAGVAVLPGCIEGSPELGNIQTPTLVLVQVVTDLHGAQVCQGGRVQRVLGDGDHHSRTVTTLATHQQLQHGLGLGGQKSIDSIY